MLTKSFGANLFIKLWPEKGCKDGGNSCYESMCMDYVIVLKSRNIDLKKEREIRKDRGYGSGGK